MKMTSDEDYFFEMICTNSGKDINTVREVLRAILISTILTIYNQYDKDKEKNNKLKENFVEFFIPYICKLKIDYSKDEPKGKYVVTNVNLSAVPSPTLIKEIYNILENKTLDLEKNIKNEINLKINNILENLEEDK